MIRIHEYKLTAIVLDITGHRFSKPVGIKKIEIDKRFDNFKITSHKVTCRIIYQWGTCTGAISRLRFEIVNIEIMQRVFVNKKKLMLLVWYKHTKL
jgi:hypothetical protein